MAKSKKPPSPTGGKGFGTPTSSGPGGKNPLGIGTSTSTSKPNPTVHVAGGTYSAHSFERFWGSISDIYLKILGRRATHAEAVKAFKSGVGSYALQQNLYMSKEFVGTKLYKQMANEYHYILAQWGLGGMKLKPGMIQSFTAHGYTQSDVQAWVYRHPDIYQHTTDFRDRLASFHDAYQSAMQQAGVDPISQGITFDGQKLVKVKNGPGAPGKPGSGRGGPGSGAGPVLQGHPVETVNPRGGGPIHALPVGGNRQPPVGPGGGPRAGGGSGPPPTNSGVKSGGGFHTVSRSVIEQPDQVLHQHLINAAMNFQTDRQYKAWLTSQAWYRQLYNTSVNSGTFIHPVHSDASTTVTNTGQPMTPGNLSSRPGFTPQQGPDVGAA